MKRQQEIAYQLDLFSEQRRNAILPSENCKDVYQTKAGQEKQVNKEGKQGRALTDDLMTIMEQNLFNLSLNYEKLNY